MREIFDRALGDRLRNLGPPACPAGPSRPRIHCYTAADLPGVAKILVQLRGDVTYPDDPGGPVRGDRVLAAFLMGWDGSR